MGLIFRVSSSANTGATYIKNAALAFDEGDGNFAWLAANLSASVVEISGSVQLSGSFSIPSLTTTNQNNVVTVDTSTGRLYYTASTSFGGGGATISTASLLLTASATNNVLTFTKGDYSTFNVTVATGSVINTGSFMITGSVSNNTLTFTKGDNTTFNLTVNTGSAVAISTASFMITGSVSNNVLTFTKGDNSTFNLTVNTGSDSPISVTGSTLYSNNPSTSGFSLIGGTFLGSSAGKDASKADNSTFIGNNAGSGSISSSYSNFLGWYAGQKVGGGGAVGPRENNIIIGTGITLPNNTVHAINLGGIIYATGSLFNTGSTALASPAVDAKVGINQFNPQYNLDVSGSGNFTSGLTVSGNLGTQTVILPEVSASFNYANDAAAALAGIPLGGVYRNGNALQIRLA
jgi:hypothetical protein